MENFSKDFLQSQLGEVFNFGIFLTKTGNLPRTFCLDFPFKITQIIFLKNEKKILNTFDSLFEANMPLSFTDLWVNSVSKELSPRFFPLLGDDIVFTNLSIKNSSKIRYIVPFNQVSNFDALEKGTLDHMKFKLKYSFFKETRYSVFSLKGVSKRFKQPNLTEAERELVIIFNEIFTSEFSFDIPGYCTVFYQFTVKKSLVNSSYFDKFLAKD